MPQTSPQGRSALLLASIYLASGMLASPALAGDHKHVSKYDLVQGYILQPQTQVTVPVSPVNPSTTQTTPMASSQSGGSTLNLAPASPQTPALSPVTLQLAPAPAQVQTLQLAPAVAQVQTLQLAPAPVQVQTLQLAPAPVQVQTLQLAPAAAQVQTLQLAPAPVQVQTLQLAPAAPVQTLQLAPAMTQVQALQLAPAPVQQMTMQLQAQPVSFAPQQVCTSQTQLAVPVQLLLPHHKICHLFGW